MDIGRRIYYEVSTGKVLLNKGWMSGDVEEKTLEQEKESFPELNNPDEIGLLKLDFMEREEEFLNTGSLYINPTTKQLIIYPRLEIRNSQQIGNPQIQADGLDTLRIIAIVDDSSYMGIVEFTIDTETFYSVNCVDGIATFEFASSVVGEYIVIARNELYGINSVKVVAI